MIDKTELAFARGEHVTFLRRAQSAFDALEPGPAKTLIAASLIKRLFATLPADIQQKLLANLKGQAGKKLR